MDEFLTASLAKAPSWSPLPDVATADIRVAAVLGEASRVRALVAADPASAVTPDDARDWPPLLYACHSRWHHVDPARADGLVEVARVLLDAGASPDSSNGRPSRDGYRSALYGAAGEANHPGIVSLLLSRGANPDDDESLYHSVYFAPDLRCTRLLLSHGATIDGTNALGAMLDTGSVEGVRLLLAHGATPSELPGAIQKHSPLAIVEALLDAGADPSSAGCHPASPLRMAVATGQTEVASLLLARGAEDDTTFADRLVGSCFLESPVPADSEVVASIDHGMVLTHAAEHGSDTAVALLLDIGFDVDATGGMYDATALHHAAYNGRASLVRLLLSRGADASILDGNWAMTALDWAEVALTRDPPPAADHPAVVVALRHVSRRSPRGRSLMP